MKARWWTRRTAILAGIIMVMGALVWVNYDPSLRGQQLPVDDPVEQLAIELEHQDELHRLSTDRFYRLENRVRALEDAIIDLNRGNRVEAPYDDRLDRLKESLRQDMDQMWYQIQEQRERDRYLESRR